jgi:hypothetical protein
MTTIAEADFVFPVLGFRSDGVIFAFPNLKELTICPIQRVKLGWQDGMELIGADYRTWKVLRTRRTGLHLSYEWLFLPVMARIDYDLERVPDVPLSTLKARVLADIQRKPTMYCADCGHPEEDLSEHEAEVAAAGSVADLCKIVRP